MPSQGSYKGCSQQKMIGESHTRLEKLLVKAFSFTSSTVEATTTNKGISATKADHYFCKYRRQRLLVLFSTAALIDIPELSPLTHFYRSKSSVFSCLTSSNWIQHYQQTNKKGEHFSLAKKWEPPSYLFFCDRNHHLLYFPKTWTFTLHLEFHVIVVGGWGGKLLLYLLLSLVSMLFLFFYWFRISLSKFFMLPSFVSLMSLWCSSVQTCCFFFCSRRSFLCKKKCKINNLGRQKTPY